MNELLLPALKGLHYRDGGSGSWEGSLLDFVQRSLPPLTYLQIGGHCADEATLMHLLPPLPLLQALDLELCTISARLFELLSILDGADTGNLTVCPDLRFFRFGHYSVVGDLHACANALCTMLESRGDTLKLCDMDCLHSKSSAMDRDSVENQLRDRKDFIAKRVGDYSQRFTAFDW